ncbi:MAG: PUA domain-containing protein [Bacteriovoracaceae bacterium]
MIPFVPFNTKLEHIDLTSKTGAGRGGMFTKLLAVNKVTPLGINTIIASSLNKSPIKTALTKSTGTFFQGSLVVTKFTKKSWLMTNVKDSAILEIDEGAKNALVKGASLLPSGVKKVSGKFKRGDIVNIKYGTNIFAIGMIEYDDFEIEMIKGMKSNLIQPTLGHFYNDAIVHRNNMLLKFANL